MNKKYINFQALTASLHGEAKFRKGFTLIELLVVIAIVGTLAVVVYASLGAARDKGNAASAASSLNNAREQAELYHNSSGSYADICTAVGGIYRMLEGALETSQATSINTNNSANGSTSVVTCHSSAIDWVAAAPIHTGEYYCVDSNNFGGIRTSPVASNAVECPAS